jgi:hypothetical protein
MFIPPRILSFFIFLQHVCLHLFNYNIYKVIQYTKRLDVEVARLFYSLNQVKPLIQLLTLNFRHTNTQKHKELVCKNIRKNVNVIQCPPKVTPPGINTLVLLNIKKQYENTGTFRHMF